MHGRPTAVDRSKCDAGDDAVRTTRRRTIAAADVAAVVTSTHARVDARTMDGSGFSAFLASGYDRAERRLPKISILRF